MKIDDILLNEQNKNYDIDFINRIQYLLNNIPLETGGKYYTKYDYKVGFICDPYLYNIYKDIATESVYINPKYWKTQLQSVDILIVGSVWFGIEKMWHRKDTVNYGIIDNVIQTANKQGKLTIFYSTEDPVSYDLFLEIAKKCEYIFTTCVEMIPNYVKDCGHNRVFDLQFCVNPYLSNPTKSFGLNKFQDVIFSGSYYSQYPKRKKDTHLLFDAVLRSRFGLKIVDHNFNLNEPYLWRFPSKYWSYVSPAISHELVQKLHKLYDFALNLNTITNSDTMYAVRVYELQAIGNIVFSNNSIGMSKNFSNINIVEDIDSISSILDTIKFPEIAHAKKIGIRNIMTNNTCYERFGHLLKSLGMKPKSQDRRIAVVVSNKTDKLSRHFLEQSYDLKEFLSVDEFKVSYDNFDMVAFWDNEIDYNKFYLEDASNAFKFSESRYVYTDNTFINSYIKGEVNLEFPYEYIDSINSRFTTVFWRDDYDYEHLLNLFNSPNKFLKLPMGYKIF